ncbi:twin-arginine translocase subunit TatC [Aestuariivirga litoralis]|uniref:twin-arginine translocase subunit TatC n=1 Tax=Aestuariivirga litoralis TaxID=2650924 RepID=UPI0018C4BBA3|nr:twin-arginine translocase subunit TatC [Aestuariivirga litoralis]MBG1231368.1 twin-arginine translocase subunit TatC [Aestuariivirga litoralis]
MSQADIDASEAPLLDHLVELRQRLIYSVVAFFVAFFVAFYFSSEILHLLILPFKKGTGQDVALISIKLLGVFLVKLKIAIFGGLFVAFPWIATQVYRFVAPGLYKHERQALFPYLFATPIFFVMGAALVYFMLLPVAIRFFFALAASTGDSTSAGIQLMPDIESYLDFVMTLILAFGVTFQLPVILTLLGQLGIVKQDQLKKGRRFALVGVAILAGVITPPDPISMISMIVPLFALYEVAVITVGFMERRRASKSTDITTTE